MLEELALIFLSAIAIVVIVFLFCAVFCMIERV